MELTIFIAVTAAAVVLQAGVMVGMFLAVRKTGAKVEALAEDIRTKVVPAVGTINSLIVDVRPKVEAAIANISESTSLVRAQLERVDATVSDLMDRSHLQIIRADDMVTRTLDKVEATTETVHNAVVSPVRKLSGMVHGITAAFEYLANGRRRENGDVTVPQEEMFI